MFKDQGRIDPSETWKENTSRGTIANCFSCTPEEITAKLQQVAQKENKSLWEKSGMEEEEEKRSQTRPLREIFSSPSSSLTSPYVKYDNPIRAPSQTIHSSESNLRGENEEVTDGAVTFLFKEHGVNLNSCWR